MRTCTKGLLVTLAIASTLTLGACQQSNQTKAEQSQVSQAATNKANSTKSQNQEIAPDGWLIVDNETFIPVVNRLGEHLSQARQAYLKGDNNTAASAMRRASDLLRQEMTQANQPDQSKPRTFTAEPVMTDGQAALKQASDDLMSNASLVQRGEIDSVKDLDKIFTQVYQANTEQLWIVADEQDWIPIVEMPQQHWQTAKQKLLDGNKQLAAVEISKGIAFLTLEANRTTDKNIKSDILNTAQDLEQLANNVRDGEVSDAKMLDRAFARGQLTMSRFYENQAQASESQGELTTAGKEVIAAFEHLQAANTWLRGKDNAALKQVKTEINALRDSLSSPNEAQSRNLGKAIATVERQIVNLDRIAKS